MSGEPFTLDTNILVYAIDKSAGDRHIVAVEIIEWAVKGRCRLTLQAISEFYSAASRKQMLARQHAADTAKQLLVLFPTVAASASAVGTALALSVAGRASYWDALLVATAAEAGCTTVLTEDMADGSELCGLRLANPFDGPNLSAFARRLLPE
ncbi:MAG: PIN domain-containing protein [Acetobacteraceae bacterium]|nr:PIN domain-containing protein [Acetobacteraceae bacterium]